MDRPQWNRIQEIYYLALTKAPAERSAFVASACEHDPDLIREVNLLLEADKSLGGFLESPLFELALKLFDAGIASETNLIGKTIDQRYRVEAELGRGAMGRIYLARDLELHGRPVVIKVLLQTVLSDPYVVKKFKQEVEALARVDHPNVVGLLGAGELANGQRYTVMQRVSGLTLRSQITNEGMNLERAAAILKQVGAGLDHVHENGILHRDLKPENIMLQRLSDGSELVKIVDFGIAKVRESVVASSTTQNLPVGTLAYMSPEQLRGEDDLTSSSDIFSLAVIAYEMITGRRPFNPTSAPHLLELQRKQKCVKPIDLRPGLSPEAQAIIFRGLSFNAKARYQKASEFGDNLARALNKPARNSPIQDPLMRQRTAIVGLLVALICVAALVGVYLYSGRDEAPALSRGPTRSFNYWLTVQKMRYGEPYQEPYKSNGQDTFESGDQCQLHISCAESGYLYVFNEGPSETDGATFRIAYPTRDKNRGSATVGADQPVQIEFTFKGPPGSENFWIVWSASPVSELESAKNAALQNTDGGLMDQNLVATRSFLKTKESEYPVKVTRYKLAQVTTVRGPGDLLITLAQFKHR